MFGNFRKLTSKIEDYLMAPAPHDLFAKILSRLEEDYERGQYARYVERIIFQRSGFLGGFHPWASWRTSWGVA